MSIIRPAVAEDLKASARDFCNVVWPVLQGHQWFSGGDLLPSEAATLEVGHWAGHASRGHVVDDSATAKLVRSLDCLAGIDGWHLDGCVGMRGIASRVQWGVPYKSFTVRWARQSGAETEWAKLQKMHAERAGGWVRPFFRVQAYLDKQGGALICAFAARQDDIAEFCTDDRLKREWTVLPNQNEEGRTVEFAVLWVDALRGLGVEVAEFGDVARARTSRTASTSTATPAARGVETSAKLPVYSTQTSLPLHLAPTINVGGAK